MAISGNNAPKRPSDPINFTDKAAERAYPLLEQPKPPSYKDGDGDGDGGGTEGDKLNISERLSHLEGGLGTLKWSAAIVSSVLVGGMALLLGAIGILLSMMLDLQSQFGDISARVDALPGEINQNLMELNRTLADAITAARSSEQPTVIVIDPGQSQTDQ